MKRQVTAILCCALAYGLSAQNATLEGVVNSANIKEGLLGVNVVLIDTGHGTITGQHGAYKLTEIPPGKQRILFSYLGFDTREVELEFMEGEIQKLDVTLAPGSIDLSAVSIEARRPFSAASSKAIRDFDLKVKPVRSAQDMLQMVPGLVIAQHAGGGKAEQIYMRGFDADHGTDVGIYVDGMPVNMVTHGHGQGYADLHFIIPEIIEGLEVFKGPYFGRFGNFGTAGSVELLTAEHPEKNLVKLEGGMFQTARATTVLKIPTGNRHQSAYMAGQYAFTNGPVENPQGFQRGNLYGKFHTHLTPKSELGLSVGAFSSAWNASGQIPQRAVDEELITRWGAIDPMEGGITGRYNLAVDYHFAEGYEQDFQIQAFMSQYDFRLYSNFTFWLNDPVYGDMIEQTDHRNILGINAKYSFFRAIGKVRSFTRVGANFRGDHIDLSLWKSPDRKRMAPLTEHFVAEKNMAFWLEEDLIFSKLFKLQLGLRGDYFTFDVNDLLDRGGPPVNDLPHGSGLAQAALLSPKLNLVLSPARHLDIFLNSGTGFHSNDARDVIMAEQIKTLPRAIGTELGIIAGGGHRLLVSLAAWYLYLEEELVFVGDEGSTEISGETRRIGVDAEVRIQVARSIWADLDVNLSNGRYLDEPQGANYIPLAPRMSSQGGVNFKSDRGMEGALRFRYVGDRPANGDNTVVALGSFIGNLVLAYRFEGFRFFIQLENLLNSEWNEAQFDTESRLYYEMQAVSEIHFTPGNPFNFQAGISFEF